MKSIFLLLISLFLFTSLIAQKKVGSFLEIEKIYTKGDYKDALRKSKTLVNKLEDKDADKYLYTCALYQQAKLYDALSRFEDYTNTTYLAANALSLLSQANAEEYAKTLCYAAQTYMEYGDYVNGTDKINQAKLLADQKKIKNIVLINEVNLTLAWSFYYTGFFNKSVATLKTTIPSITATIVKKEPYTDDKGNLKNKKVGRPDLEKRREALGEAMYLLAKTYLSMEDLPRADSMIDESDSYIHKHQGKKSILYINNLLLESGANEAFGNIRKAGFIIDKAGSLLSKANIKNYSRPALAVQREWVLSYKKRGQPVQANKRQNIMDVRINRYYNKYSIYKAHSELLDLEKYFSEPALDRRDYEKAAEKVNLILSSAAFYPPVHKDKLTILERLYKLQLANDDFQSADKTLADLIQMEEKVMGKESPYYRIAQLYLANYNATVTNNFKKAENLFNNNLSYVGEQMGPMYQSYINFNYDIIRLYSIIDEYDKGYKIALSNSTAIKNTIGKENVAYAIALTKQADMEITLGKYTEAETNLNNAETIMRITSYDVPENNIYYSRILETFARLNVIRGNYEEAKNNFKKAVKYSSKSELESSYISEGLALLYIQTGKYQEANKNLQNAIKSKESRYGKDSRELINPLNQLGGLNIITGSFNDAQKYINRSLQISNKIFGDTSLIYASGLDKLSKLYIAIGDYEKAQETASKLLSIQIEQYGKKNVEVGKTLNELALIKFYNNKNKQQIENLFLESLTTISGILGDDNPEWAEVTKNLALFYLETGRLEQAEEGLNKANTIWVNKFGPNNVHSAEIHTLKGNTAYQRKKFADAKNEYLIARNIYSKIFDANHPNYVKALSQVGKMNFILGDYKTAYKNFDETTSIYLSYIKKYFPSLSDREKTKFWNLIKPDFEFYCSLAIKLKDENPDAIGNMYNFALTTKALLLNSSIKVRQRILNSGDTSLISKYDDWMTKKEFLTSVLAMSPEQINNSGLDPKTVEKEVETLEKELSESSEIFANNYEKEDYKWKDIQAKLDENEVAIEVIRYRKYNTSFTDSVMYAVLIVTPTTRNNPQLILLDDGKLMETRYLKYYRNCIKHNIEDDISYNNYWKPIEKAITNKKAKIYFSPDGVYNQINVESLKSNNTYVIDSSEILLVNNTKEIIKNKLSMQNASEPNKSKKKVKAKDAIPVADLFGNPIYYADSTVASHKISQLQGAEKEVSEINSLLVSQGWDSEMYVEINATEEDVKSLRSPKLLHIATHGFFMEDTQAPSDAELEGINEGKSVVNPLLKSGLLFVNGGYLVNKTNAYAFNSADGILTSYEAMNLNFDNTELVVLSACETGLGEIQLGEGVYGLQRAFMMAGAKTIIMSLFKVSDEVTQELMITFYKQWLLTNDKRKAFLYAKKAIKEKYKEPLYWGSFVMIGIN